MSEQVGVDIAAAVGSYICDPDIRRVEITALSTAKEIANATATAIASVVAECTAQGNGMFLLNGRSLAQAEAVAIAESFAGGLVEANVCGFCELAADFIVDNFKDIFILAASQIEVTLAGQARPGEIVTLGAAVTNEEIVAASTTAYAQVMIAATADIDKGCTGQITAVVGGIMDTCTVSVKATDDSFIDDADTALVVNLYADACSADEDVIVATNVTTKATATAMARAIAEITSSCAIEGDSTACVVSEANINTTATAVASAFASAAIGARSTCDPPLCETSNDALTSAFETILATATASVVTSQCSARGETFSTTALVDDIVTATADRKSVV